jgi:alpha-beta hydrolase superfamily lysophospholipase
MPQRHYLQEPLAFGVDSWAHWSVNPDKTALVFVHGFSGAAADTWLEFPRLLTGDARASGIDLMFYGYDGLFTQAGTSADQLEEFLDAVGKNPSSLFPNFVRRGAEFAYSRIVVAAHSLGAVIVRRALLDAASYKETWPARVRFVLFAPAHRGAYVALLASEFLSGQEWFIGKLAGSVAQYNVPLLNDLSDGSPVLADLLADTRKALRSAADAPYLVAHAVVWAQQDKVVRNARFANDPRPARFPKDHQNVCKPSDAFLDPLEKVVAACL